MNVRSYSKRLLVMLLCAFMVVGMLPATAFAAEVTDPTQATEPTQVTEPTKATEPAETTASTQPADTDANISVIAEDEDAGEPVVYGNNDDGTATVPGVPGETVYHTESVTIYRLVETPVDGGQYLIVNTNTGTGKGLSASTTPYSTTAFTGGSEYYSSWDEGTETGELWASDGKTYVITDAPYLWTVGEGLTFTNGNSKLGASGGCLGSVYLDFDEPAYSTFNYTENKLMSATEGTTSYGITFSTSTNRWGVGENSHATVYFYEPVEVPVIKVTSETVGKKETATYGLNITQNDAIVTGQELKAAFVKADDTKQLGTGFFSSVTGQAPTPDGSAAGTYTWTSSNAEVATVDDNGLVTFTGAEGETIITANYTWTEDDVEYKIFNHVTFVATGTTYTLQIVDADKNSLDGIIPVKGDAAIEAGLDLNALVTYQKSETESEEITNAQVAWSVSNASIATIAADGKVTFTGVEGAITVTATYTANGKVYTDTVNITVSKSTYFVPEDGTNDFPEYPNEGAIRIDKNAQAVGNFSDTGVAKVELSMTGVPYSVGNEIDVVIMIDMSDSMKNNNAGRVQPARDSANAALEAIVKNENGEINNNRVAVYTFNGYDRTNPQNYANAVDQVLPLQSYQNTSNKTDTTNLTNAQASITSWIQNNNTGAGTNYGAALEKCYSVLKAAKEAYPNRKQFVIFVTDGEPTTGFAYETETGTVADDGYDSNYQNGAANKYYTYTEYYSKQMRAAGVEVYAVGIQLTNTNANTILKKIGGNSTGTAYANPSTHSDYAQFISSDESADKLVEIFEDIVNAIKEAATDVTVTDKITDEYTMILQTPENVTLPEGTDLTIDVLQYTLDADKKRTGDPVVIESIDLNSDKVTKDAAGNITKIEADNFTYDASTHIITWTADKLDNKELALSYYLYLKNSAGYDSTEQTAAGTYPTNEYATIEYTNHLDHECKKEFPKPQLTWNGAQVSYTFYLVNDQGQPVNRAGRVIPFAEAIYVTDVYTESVTWDTDEDKTLSANMIAQELLPDVYELYDPSTSYVINVYEDEEGKDLGNHFVITANKTTTADEVTTSTTKVFNTKSGTIYSAPGTYTKDNVYTGFDFANTTVAFAVKWTRELAEDTVVVDYGLDVVIDVATNDALETKVVGVRADQPTGVAINSGNYVAAKAQETEVKLDDMTLATASVENLTSVRFSLDENNGMKFTDPAVFYYESEVSYLGTDNVQTTANMYSSVTVIPATTVYYEDDFVTFTNSQKVANGIGEWATVGTVINATQAQDRPGEKQISATLDADNNYGYDAAYSSMTQYSMGAAKKVTVAKDISAMASFDFYGTGFDVISLTDNKSGMIVVNVYDTNNELEKSLTVNNYYGYAYVDGEWVTVDSNDPNALYQVPVMKISGLTYGKHTAKIVASYNYINDATGAGRYDFYLDAIRVYDPTGVVSGERENADVSDAYKADGEGWPAYHELRNWVIDAKTFNSLGGDTVNGIVFIDGGKTGPDGKVSIEDYTSFGPNNELYLEAGKAVAFDLNATAKAGSVAQIQLAVKTVGGTGSVQIYNAATTSADTAAKMSIGTATDMYYDITDLNGKTVVIRNSGSDGDAIVSITNIKVTYTEAQPAVEAANVFSLRRASVNTALMSLATVEEDVEEPTTPEPTEPEETEPEETEPEETKPGKPNKPDKEEKPTKPDKEEQPTKPGKPDKEEKPSANNKYEQAHQNMVQAVKKIEKAVKYLFGWLFR